MSSQHTFTSAYTRLKEIHTLLSTKEMLDIDSLVAMQKEAKELHDFLVNRLHTVNEDINAKPTPMEK